MDMQTQLRWTILVLTLLLATSSALECSQFKDQANCTCNQFDSTDIQCPEENPEITLSVSKNHQVMLECLGEQSSQLDLETIPSLNLTDAKLAKVKYCFLNNSFADILLEKFHMQKLESLYFESVVHWQTNQEITISKESFESLHYLQTLQLSFSAINLEPDFLANTPNLTRLTINKNSITKLDRYFDYVPKLNLLDISGNFIQLIPDRVFEKLSNLTTLMLFNNNITTLTNVTFKGLENLKLLELSANQIQELPEDTFAQLKLLRTLSLRTNSIKIIYSKTFSENTLLENVRLGRNPGLILENGVLANLTSLKIVELSYNEFTDVRENTFQNCLKLEEIDLSNNQLTAIPERLFAHLTSLRELNLSKNKLNNVPDSALAHLVKLKVLKLDNNELTRISEKLFLYLDELISLELQKNLIDTIEGRAFTSLEKLIDLNLSFNKWNNTYIFPVSPLASLLSIENIDLAHNQLTDVPELFSMLHIRKVDLRYNQVEYLPLHPFVHKIINPLQIDLSYNKLQFVDFHLTDYLFAQNMKDSDPYGTSSLTTLIINGNPIICDCYMYDLARYNANNTQLKVLLDIVQDELVCANDNKTKILQVKPNQIECPVVAGCPNDCKCWYKPFYTAVAVNCSFVGLKSYPKVDFTMLNRSYNQTFMVLRGNNLTAGPTGSEDNYDKITVLDLSRNSITELGWIPSKILELNLDDNLLDNLNRSVIQQLKNATTLRKLKLKNNPWHCSCESADLQKFLMQNNHFKVNSSDVYCENFKTELVDKTDICKMSPLLSILLFVTLAMLLMCSLAFALYYRYETEIKVYLFAKNLCLWFITEDELDKDKTYDVFISYAHPDEKFVEEQLLPELERKDNPYKVCIHIRDWVPGEFIAEQVVNSVRDSKRTLVVLSNNFLDSVWGKLEFRTAHTQAISEGRARVIVVIYGDLDESKLDDELKSYMKTNTYVKWGDKYFWNKLKYALPHARGNFYEANKKHAKVMLKIDDKFDLIKNPPSPSNTSTPPITLDPALLESKHLALDLTKRIEGENPLLVKEV